MFELFNVLGALLLGLIAVLAILPRVVPTLTVGKLARMAQVSVGIETFESHVLGGASFGGGLSASRLEEACSRVDTLLNERSEADMAVTAILPDARIACALWGRKW